MRYGRPKYGQKKQRRGGRSFDSKLEANVFEMLRLRELAGEITEIKQQVNVHLTKARILYKPDYSYIDCETQETIYVEAKGFETPVWRIKRRLWKCYGPGPLMVYRGANQNFFLKETLIPDTNTEQI